MKKHLLKKLLLGLAVLFTANLFASDIRVGGIWYDFNDGKSTATVTFKGEKFSSFADEYTGDVVIPETVTYNGKTYTVTKIGDEAFRDCKDVTSIVIPNTVTHINSMVFRNCTKLTSLHIPASVTWIGTPAEYYMTTITVDENNPVYDSRNNCNAIIETAKNTLYIGCAGTVIPNTVTSIYTGAFQHCKALKNIVIPESVTEIERAGFSGCSNLTEIICCATTPPTCQNTLNASSFQYVPTGIPVYVPAGSVDAYKAADVWKDFTNIQAIQSYGITVAGVDVTQANANDVLGDGTVKFDKATNTLILTNANIDGQGNDGILVEANNVTIQLNGMNTIAGSWGTVFSKTTGGKIVGPGSATIESIFLNQSDLLIKECNLLIESENYGIVGISGNDKEKLTIDNAYVHVGAGPVFTCGNISNLTLTNAKFSSSGVSYSSTLKGVSSDGGNTLTKNSFSIVPSAGAFPIVIEGIGLYAFNAADPMGDGTVSYDVSRKTLTLNKANLKCDDYDVIAVWDDINIQFIDTNTIVCNGNYNAINVDDVYTTRISGNYKSVLNLQAKDGDGFYGGELHISGGCTVNATGGIYGLALTGEDLYIDNSRLTATSTSMDDSEYAISGMKAEPQLTKAELITEGVTYNSTKQTYVDADGKAAKQVAFERTIGIVVKGITVTKENMNDVLGDGTVKYDKATSTLILTNANIETASVSGIQIQANDVTIQLNGMNNISSTASSGIVFTSTTGGSIVGPGCADIYGKNTGICMNLSDLLIKDCYLTVKGLDCSLAGQTHSSFEDLTIDNAYVYMQGASNSSGQVSQYTCGKLNSLTLKDCGFSSNSIGFSNSLHGISTDGGNTLTINPVVIAPTTRYPVVIKGMQLFTFNAADPFGDGAVSYDHATQTLTFNNANISYEYDAISIYEDINIIVKGTNNISSVQYNAIFVDDYKTYISGDADAVLNMTSEKSNAYYSGETHISGGCTVNAVGGIYGMSLAGDDLYIDGSTLVATTTGTEDYLSAIGNTKGEPILTNTTLATKGIHFDATKKVYVDADGNGAKTITIKPIKTYNITVAGTQVTSMNADDVLGDGTVKYDEAANTLILTNANIEGTTDCGIKVEVDNITIQLNGVNNISSTKAAGFFFSQTTSCKIVGPGKANIIGTDESNIGIFIRNSDLLIKDCELNTKGPQYSIAGLYGNDKEVLTISNAKVIAELTGDESWKEGTIMDIHNLVLDGVSIRSPKGATFDTNEKAVVVDGAVTKETVVIGPDVPTYTLTISAGENGSVNTAVNGTYDEGTSVNLIATANTGYKFEKWSDGNADNPRTLVMDKDYTLTASFVDESVVINKYTITANVNDAAMGSVSGAGEYIENSDVTLTATANTGYEFVNWTEGSTEVSTDATYTFKATENITLTANFKAIITYTITATVNDATMGSVNGDGVYVENTDVTLVATANTGYEFVNWTKGGTEVSTDATYTFKATENVTLTANFQVIDTRVELIVYTVGQGKVNNEKTYKTKVEPGTKVTLNAVPSKTSYKFAHWNNRTYGDDEEATITIEMTEDLSIAAVFIDEEDAYKLTARVEDGEEEFGRVKITLCVDEENGIYVPAMNGTYPAETILRISAVANEGYKFVCWNKEDEEPNTSESRKITLTGKRTYLAHFQKVKTDLDEVIGTENDNTMYDILGRKVDANYKGIVIMNGKKFLVR